jgi:hypothetical protein
LSGIKGNLYLLDEYLEDIFSLKELNSHFCRFFITADFSGRRADFLGKDQGINSTGEAFSSSVKVSVNDALQSFSIF